MKKDIGHIVKYVCIAIFYLFNLYFTLGGGDKALRHMSGYLLLAFIGCFIKIFTDLKYYHLLFSLIANYAGYEFLPVRHGLRLDGVVDIVIIAFAFAAETVGFVLAIVIINTLVYSHAKKDNDLEQVQEAKSNLNTVLNTSLAVSLILCYWLRELFAYVIYLCLLAIVLIKYIAKYVIERRSERTTKSDDENN